MTEIKDVQKLRDKVKDLKRELAQFRVLEADLKTIREYMATYAQLHQLAECDGSLDIVRSLLGGVVPEVIEPEVYQVDFGAFMGLWEDAKNCSDDNLADLVQRLEGQVRSYQNIEYLACHLTDYKRAIEVLLEVLDPTNRH